MGIYAGPKISENALRGLVLAFDAANPKSYVGSGTTWSDVSGKNSNGQLSVKDYVYNVYDLLVEDYVLPNSESTKYPTYNTSNLGSIVFDGIDDYFDFFAPNLGTTTTVELWIKLGSSYREKIIFGWLYYCVWCQNGSIGYNTGNSDLYGISSTVVSNLGLTNKWAHYVFEMYSNISYTNNKIYINGNLQTLSNQSTSTENSSNRNFNSGNGRICSWRTNMSYSMPMNCSSIKIYNRALTAAEIQQNFNTTRGRYGI